MKIKYANNPNPKNILENTFKCIKVSDEFFDGYISLVDVKKIRKIVIVPRYGGRTQKVFDINNKWLLLYPKEKNYTITAMYDENYNFIEFYIDMVDKVGVTSSGIPYMHDLFLDVVITNEHEIYVLDQDELYEALQNHDITSKQYNTVNDTSKYIISEYSSRENFEKLKWYCYEKIKYIVN